MTMVSDLTTHLVVFGTVAAIVSVAIFGYILRDCWRNRWEQKICGEETDSDLKAFVQTIYDNTTPSVLWHRVALTGPLIGVAVWSVWAALTVLVTSFQ